MANSHYSQTTFAGSSKRAGPHGYMRSASNPSHDVALGWHDNDSKEYWVDDSDDFLNPSPCLIWMQIADDLDRLEGLPPLDFEDREDFRLDINFGDDYDDAPRRHWKKPSAIDEAYYRTPTYCVDEENEEAYYIDFYGKN